MSKKECTCEPGCDCEVEYYDCDCEKSCGSKILKVGACIGGIAILGGIITALIIKNKRDNY